MHDKRLKSEKVTAEQLDEMHSCIQTKSIQIQVKTESCNKETPEVKIEKKLLE